MYEWRRVDDEKPPQNFPVDTKIDDQDGVRNEQVMSFHHNLWWAGDMYVYYRPTHWKFREERNA